jgi:hypothetical protein
VEQPAVITYTTCRDCGGLLHTTDGDTVHPLCTPKPTRVEQLAQQWLAAALNGDAALEAELHTRIEDIDNRAPRLLDAALLYASWGWPVFPLLPLARAATIAHQTGEPISKVAKRPATRNGFKDATADPDRIRAWWTRHPDSNIGLPTGLAFDVIDVDPPDGIPSYLALLGQQDLQSHGRVTTSSGGTHLYVLPTGRGNSSRTMPGVDYRGAGGYVVAPPSTLGTRGRSWQWSDRPSPTIIEVARG